MVDFNDESSHEGSFSDNEVVHSSSTPMDEEEASSSDNQMLDSCKIGTRIAGINLELALEIHHEDCRDVKLNLSWHPSCVAM